MILRSSMDNEMDDRLDNMTELWEKLDTLEAREVERTRKLWVAVKAVVKLVAWEATPQGTPQIYVADDGHVHIAWDRGTRRFNQSVAIYDGEEKYQVSFYPLKGFPNGFAVSFEVETPNQVYEAVKSHPSFAEFRDWLTPAP